MRKGLGATVAGSLLVEAELGELGGWLSTPGCWGREKGGIPLWDCRDRPAALSTVSLAERLKVSGMEGAQEAAD